MPSCSQRLVTNDCSQDCNFSAFFNTLSGFALLDSMFLQVSKTTLTFAQTFELEYGFRFVEARAKDAGEDIKCSHVLPGASIVIHQRHISIVKTILRCLKHLNFLRLKHLSLSTQRIRTVRLLKPLEMLIQSWAFALPSTTSGTRPGRNRIFLFSHFTSLEGSTCVAS